MKNQPMNVSMVYEKHESNAEICKIEIYAVPGGYSFGVTVMVKWQGFGTPCMNRPGESDYLLPTENDALIAAVKYIRHIISSNRNYTAKHKEIIEKMLPDIIQKDLF